MCEAARKPLKRGLEGSRLPPNNAGMNRKQHHTHGWDEEPLDESSEFSPTTGCSLLSGYHPMHDPTHCVKPRGRFGLKTMLAFCVLLLALGGWAIASLASLLRA